MGELQILPATAERWPDIELLLGGDGDHGCWCQAWRGSATAFGLPKEASHREALRLQLGFDVPPGFIAYLDGEPAGWCGVGIRAETPRLLRSRTIPAIDDRPVWCIGCFRIRVGHRRKGVATNLLTGVIEAARAAGAPGVEAYPIDPGGRRVDVSFGFVGIASMFDRAGFHRVLETGGHAAGLPRILVRLDFGDPAAAIGCP
jgi:GNAT superfamily N-acetyltransferase